MQSLNLLQGIIHKLETSAGLRYLKLLVFLLCAISLWIAYDIHSYRNMSSPEAMDAAQLARNISQGKGYTTEFVRPLSIYMVKQNHSGADDKDPARLKNGHPDISNAPVYPVILAGLMKVYRFTSTQGGKEKEIFGVSLIPKFREDGEAFGINRIF